MRSHAFVPEPSVTHPLLFVAACGPFYCLSNACFTHPTLYDQPVHDLSPALLVQQHFGAGVHGRVKRSRLARRSATWGCKAFHASLHFVINGRCAPSTMTGRGSQSDELVMGCLGVGMTPPPRSHAIIMGSEHPCLHKAGGGGG